jgi:hypothetical protein
MVKLLTLIHGVDGTIALLVIYAHQGVENFNFTGVYNT